ncbi:protein VAC14 homolog isoform X1 [Anneissia japonica]|uniref:protein VAC14 homolog isoform X1 n=1 Tax=Anneissia japonica TaxID=1529436 RepID=UPI001425B707|nr:protein VAC14 homolog isoform X1 [Anneissia japonica]
MTDKIWDQSPLTPACARALNDKIYEKRKAAALEIERVVKEFAQTGATQQIMKLVNVLSRDFALSSNPHARKGGLIGLAATAIGLGKEVPLFLPQLINPVLTCLSDQDSKNRYYACEALYNIVKVARGAVLQHFNSVFCELTNLASDPDLNVKNGSELLDRLMKDIVTESNAFDVIGFIPELRDRIHATNSFTRQFLISWVTTLDSVPDINMLEFLQEILDGMFLMLGDQNKEIRKMCEYQLDAFLQEIKRSPSGVDFSSMVNILTFHSQSSVELIQLTAITWLRDFVNIAGRSMLFFASSLLTAVLPCLATEGRDSVKEVAKSVNQNLMRLVTTEDDKDEENSKDEKKDKVDLKEEKSEQNNEGEPVEKEKEMNSIKLSSSLPPNLRLEIAPVVEVLLKHLQHSPMQTKIAVLRWIYHLHLKTPRKIFQHVKEIFPVLLNTLSDVSDEVVLLDLEVLSEVASSPAGPQSEEGLQYRPVPGTNIYFTKFMINLLDLFCKDSQLLEDRGFFIIRQLCLLLKLEDVYRTLSEILLHKEDLKFATNMVQTLNTILLTSTELFELRNQLKDLKTKEICSLFCCLYKTWCHNPVATVSLCFLTQNYKHACDIIFHFGELEVTVDFLTEIDKLIQLLESPIFTYLRLQLLDGEHNQYLMKSLYGLLMLLPQSTAFSVLRHRLDCIPSRDCLPSDNNKKVRNYPEKKVNYRQSIDFDELLQHFKIIREKHSLAKQTGSKSLSQKMKNAHI